MLKLIETVVAKSLSYLEGMPKEVRKEIGQFFTSLETAEYMASMFTDPPEHLALLDPGAGSGILSAAVIERLQGEKVKSVSLTCYETNEAVLPLLLENLKYLQEMSVIPMTYEVKAENYITSQGEDFELGIEKTCYDWVIGNPPYKKISKDAAEAVSMPSVCYGAPNLYFLFSAMSLYNLKEQGEMVYIIPRSWTSGAYFKKFRDYLLSNGMLEQIHLFISRDKVFEAESVLQETIIIKVVKGMSVENVRITSSHSNRDFENIQKILMPYDVVVSGAENFVYLVTTDSEKEVLKCFNQWKDTLPSIGLKMKTGLTVDFRSREYLRIGYEKDTVPLLYSQHIQYGRVVFPIGKENEYITTEKSGLIQKNKNYLLVKRFTAKEEKRRLQCGIYLADSQPNFESISTQNKVNFIEGVGFEMSVELTYGLYVLFNSTLYDSYYRILNGSTQVNSTEVNSIPVPSLSIIEKLGRALMMENGLGVKICDKLLGVYVNG